MYFYAEGKLYKKQTQIPVLIKPRSQKRWFQSAD